MLILGDSFLGEKLQKDLQLLSLIIDRTGPQVHVSAKDNHGYDVRHYRNLEVAVGNSEQYRRDGLNNVVGPQEQIFDGRVGGRV